MKAHIVAFALGPLTAQSMEEQLREFFSARCVTISAYCLEKSPPQSPVVADLAVISSETVLPMAAPYIHPTVRTLVARRSLDVDALDKLLSLPYGTKVITSHTYPAGARQIADSIRELGFSHITCYSPYEDQPEQYAGVTTAVTAGDPGNIPCWVTKVIDIGPREIELASLVEIARLINYPMDKSGLLSLPFTKEIVKRTECLRQALQYNELLHSQIKVVLNSVRDALIAVDDEGVIRVLNHVAQDLISPNGDPLVGNRILDIFPSLKSVIEQKMSDHHREALVVIKGKTFHASLSPVQDERGMESGALVVLREVTEVLRMENEVRKGLKTRGHVTRYTFRNILGISPAIRSTIANAKKLAASELNVLIFGENGTGKELFAHSIHAASPRSGGPFVAANCASLPATLIESELFGYEDGAFTGARKGGKPGLIEQAHGGTIFLDEVGDISLEAQARLLRVIQEKEVARIGCTKIIPVDVRIIAATNRDIKQLVHAEKFRLDLYYRLFVAPLYVPPLRERKQDIPFLAKQFLQDNHLSPELLDDEFMEHIITYSWPGNVRELQSVIQYAAVIADEPETFKRTVLERIGTARHSPPDLPVNIDKAETPLYCAILKIFQEARLLGFSLGRGTLADKLSERGYSLSDQALRRRMEILCLDGMLLRGKGRQGSKITELGVQMLIRLQKE